MDVVPSWKGLARYAAQPRNLLAAGIAAVCLKLLFGEAGHLDVVAVANAIDLVSPIQWMVALALTGLSFLVVGQYDALFHKWLKTGVSAGRARRSGMAAIALAQTVGMGLATGTLARWRCLPELSLPAALKVTNYVSISFMAALGMITAVALALSPIMANNGTFWFATGAIALTALALVLSVLRPHWLPISLPPARLMLRLTALAALDVMLAGLALWVLLPEAAQHVLDPTLFFAAFVVALGAGLLSGAPGGMGPFELCLIALLPTVPKPELIAAVLCFRLVYYALPAILAVAVMVRPKPASLTHQTQPPLPRVSRAEAKGLARLPGHAFLIDHTCALHVAEASQCLVGLGDPASGGVWQSSDLKRLSETAATRQLWPTLYKVSGQSAVAARRAGWSTRVISDNAFLEPRTFSTDGPARRQLRRKLRQAEKAGIEVTEHAFAPTAEMAEVVREWAHRSGGERGFSMGRFCIENLQGQRCFVAHRNGTLVAFATFHTAKDEWVLDLMRSRDNTPDGTMHALVVEAIRMAGAEHISTLSLAAIPREDVAQWSARLGAGCEGLRRFKMSFGPRLSPLYAAAPNPVLLAVAAADIGLRIARPEPLESVKNSPHPAMQNLHFGSA